MRALKILIALILACSIGFTYYKTEPVKYVISFMKNKGKGENEKYVHFDVISNISTTYFIKFGINIPCADKAQADNIERKLPAIKSDFLTTIDHELLEKWIRTRDIATIKANFLQIINKHSDKHIETIFFNTFNYF